MRRYDVAMSVMASLLLAGCMGPTIVANRSMVEFYNATTDGKNYKSADKASSVIDAAKEYDQAASVNTGDGTSNTENAPVAGKADQAEPAEPAKPESEPVPAKPAKPESEPVPAEPVPAK